MFTKNNILSKLNHKPTSCQDIATEKLVTFLHDTDNKSVFILNGYAGTGKTSLISALTKAVKEYKKNVVLMAPTGRAAKVFSLYSGSGATTIHKCIYRKKSTKQNDSSFVLNFKKYNNTLFIVDEASMISNYNTGDFFGSGRLLEDLFSFVFNNQSCKLILCGDTAQLPPVGTELSPALDINYLGSYGYKLYTAELKTVVRQTKHTGILFNATEIRKRIKEDNCEELPKIKINSFDDIVKISGEEIIDKLEESIYKYGTNETKIICRSNMHSNKYNQGLRARVLWKEEELSIGDILMIVKNNYSALDEKAPIDFIANGDIVEVVRVKKKSDVFGYRYVDVTVKFIDYPDFEIDTKIVLDALTVNSSSMPDSYIKELYNNLNDDYQHIEDSEKRHIAIMQDDYYNALQVKYAYAFTCHKSQGGQWKCIFIDYGWIKDEMINSEFYRWLYTAITRASEKLYLVNFDERFFDD